jgi:hypothetical protein
MGAALATMNGFLVVLEKFAIESYSPVVVASRSKNLLLLLNDITVPVDHRPT